MLPAIDEKKKRITLLLEWASAEPQNVKVLKECGELLLADQRTRDAVNMLENACALDSTDAHIHGLLAKV